MKKKWLIIIIIIFAFIGYGFLRKENSNSEVVEEKKDHVSEYCTRFLQTGKSVEGDNYFVIGYEVPTSVPSRYIIETDYLIRYRSLGMIEETGWHIFQDDIDRFLFHVYSIENGEKIKTLNIKQIFEENSPTLQLTSLNSCHFRPYRNEPYIVFEVEKRPDSFEDGLEDTYKRAYLNIETEEYQIMDYSREQSDVEEKQSSEWAREGYIFHDPDFDLCELNGITEASIGYLKYWDGVCDIYLPLNELPIENDRLYRMFPQLKEKVKEEKEKVRSEEKENNQDIENDVLYVDINLVNYSTPEDVMRLLLPEGQEISFEGMGISESRSIDGEVHEINSFEEYQQYLKPIENQLDESDIHPYFK